MLSRSHGDYIAYVKQKKKIEIFIYTCLSYVSSDNTAGKLPWLNGTVKADEVL